MTTKSPGNVVMLKKSVEADTASHTRPQAPAAERRKSSIHPVLEQQLLEAADTSGKMRLRNLIEIVSHPDLRSAADAGECFSRLRAILVATRHDAATGMDLGSSDAEA